MERQDYLPEPMFRSRVEVLKTRDVDFVASQMGYSSIEEFSRDYCLIHGITPQEDLFQTKDSFNRNVNPKGLRKNISPTVFKSRKGSRGRVNRGGE